MDYCKIQRLRANALQMLLYTVMSCDLNERTLHYLGKHLQPTTVGEAVESDKARFARCYWVNK